MNSRSSFVPVCVLAGLVVFAAVPPIAVAQELPGAGVARTIIMKEDTWTGDGKLVRTRKLVRAVRPDGSSMTATLSADGGVSASEARTVTDLSARRHSLVLDSTRIVTTFWAPANTATRAVARDSGPDCQPRSRHNYQRLEDAAILGIGTVQYQFSDATSETRPRHRYTYSYAPSLDCTPLVERAEKFHLDGRLQSVMERRAIEVKLGEPDSSLFAIPSAYRELPPSEAQREALLVHGVPATASNTAVAAQDRKYFESQKHKP